MSKVIKTVFLFLFLGHASLYANEEHKWIINRDHSEIIFQVPYLKISHVSGRFSNFEGIITGTVDDIKKISLKIYSKSITTGHKIRDNHLKANDFFDIVHAPIIFFRSKVIIKKNDGNLLVKGLLKIKNISKEVVFKVEKVGSQKDTWKNESFFFKFSGLINRDDFGLSWNKTLESGGLLVGKDISITGQLQLQKRGQKTVSSKHRIPDTKGLREREKVARGEIKKDKIKTQVVMTKIDSPKIVIKNKSELIKRRPKKQKNKTGPQGLTWALVFLGLLGFIATIIISLYGKKIVQDFAGDEYEEIGKWGWLSDIIALIFAGLYAVSLWYVGWGRIR